MVKNRSIYTQTHKNIYHIIERNSNSSNNNKNMPEVVKVSGEGATLLVEFFGDYPIIKVIDFLLENRGFDYSKVEIAQNAEIGIATLHQLWGKLEKFGIVKETRKYGNTRLYMLNEENEFVKMLKAMVMKLAKEDFVKNVEKSMHKRKTYA